MDQDGELNAAELTRLLPRTQADNACGSFAEYDRDDSGGLNLDEYLERHSSLAWNKTKRSLADWATTWGMVLLILVDIGLAALVGRVVYRKFWGQSKFASSATSASPADSSSN